MAAGTLYLMQIHSIKEPFLCEKVLSYTLNRIFSCLAAAVAGCWSAERCFHKSNCCGTEGWKFHRKKKVQNRITSIKRKSSFRTCVYSIQLFFSWYWDWQVVLWQFRKQSIRRESRDPNTKSNLFFKIIWWTKTSNLRPVYSQWSWCGQFNGHSIIGQESSST